MPDTPTIEWYARNADRYVERTLDLDMSAIRDRFLAGLPPASKILDIGPGSGRDGLAFRARGHLVSMVEPSPEFADLVDELGFTVGRISAGAIRSVDEFDGIWACASLVHLDRQALFAAFVSIRRALRPYGIFYASFKAGSGTRRGPDGRLYTDLTVKDGSRFLASLLFDVLDSWETGSAEAENETVWSNFLCRKPV